jgi:hypothetical protein
MACHNCKIGFSTKDAKVQPDESRRLTGSWQGCINNYNHNVFGTNLMTWIPAFSATACLTHKSRFFGQCLINHKQL